MDEVEEKENTVKSNRLVVREHLKTIELYEGLLVDVVRTLFHLGKDKRQEVPRRLRSQLSDLEEVNQMKNEREIEDLEEESQLGELKETESKEGNKKKRASDYESPEINENSSQKGIEPPGEAENERELSFKILSQKINSEINKEEVAEREMLRTELEKNEKLNKCECKLF